MKEGMNERVLIELAPLWLSFLADVSHLQRLNGVNIMGKGKKYFTCSYFRAQQHSGSSGVKKKKTK